MIKPVCDSFGTLYLFSFFRVNFYAKPSEFHSYRCVYYFKLSKNIRQWVPLEEPLVQLYNTRNEGWL